MDWAYVAGFFDGEGHVIFSAFPSRPDYIMIGLSWANTHRGCLEAMHTFLGCGTIGGRPTKKRPTPCYDLKVTALEDVLYAGEGMLPHLIIKQEAVREMIDWAKAHRTAQPTQWGTLSKIGVEEISHLYHRKGLTQRQLATRFGVSEGAISSFFLRNGINGRRRGPEEGAYGILATYGHDKIQAMFEQGITVGEIAKEVGVKYSTVYMHFFNRGIRLTKRIRRARSARQGSQTVSEEMMLASPEIQESSEPSQPSLF